MNYTLHLTDSCNLNCKYCYEKKSTRELSIENIKQLIDYEVNQKSKCSVITFYGGEPLLKKNLIYDTINYINSKKSKIKFYYSITTNGTLIDDDFINYMKENNFINVSYSIDGIKEAHDLNRVTRDRRGTFDIVLENAKKVLENFESVVAMVTITKNNLKYLGNSVEYLISLGFKTINLLFDYTYNWQDEDLDEIKKQCNVVAEFYIKSMMNEVEIKIPLIDEKIKTHVIDGYNCNEDCNLGMKNINVGTDGNFYPCMQFVNNKDFIIGNCKDGIDFGARIKLIENSHKESEICEKCAINKRCKHTCGCKNYIITKDMNGISPIVCETEKIFIEVADKIAEELYAETSKLFIQKFYNENYGVIQKIAEEVKGE